MSLQQSSSDIICLSETRLKEQPLININIPGYFFILTDSPTNAGSVAMYISTAIQHSILTDVQMDSDGCENNRIKIEDSDVIIGTIYRHPKNDLKKFIVELNTSLEKLKNSNTVYLIGYFNINLASTDDTNSLSNSATVYIDMLSSNGYFPIISLPIRVNDHLVSIIDHIVSNDHLHSVSPGIIKCDFNRSYFLYRF